MKRIYFCILLVLLLTGCATKQHREYETIHFPSSEPISLSLLLESFSDGLYIVPNVSDDKKFLFSLPEYVIYKNRMLYISDALLEKIVVFDQNGQPLNCLKRKGNGPQEYLQITHFDVDVHGNIWILDGRRDKLLKYSSNLSFIESHDLKFQINYLQCLDDGNMLLAVSPWDDSCYKDSRVLLVDNNLNVIDSMLNYDSNVDPNFEFPSCGFATTNEGIIYHVPVSDTVYHFTASGQLCRSYYIDFAGKSIPEAYRRDIESHYDELVNYRTLVNSVFIDDNVVVGTVFYDGLFKDFIVNRKSNQLYLTDQKLRNVHLVGIYDSCGIYYIPAGGLSELNQMPDRVRTLYGDGNDVFFIIDFNQI